MVSSHGLFGAGPAEAQLYLFRRESFIAIMIQIDKNAVPFTLENESILIGIQFAQKILTIQANLR
jgi:hypothetical protein